jgi:hypothetical protein
VSPEALDALARRSERDGFARPENEAEKACYNLLSYIDSVASHVEGSTTQRKFQRNEIRSLIIEEGVPVFFITFAPPPYKNRICLYFCGLNIDLDNLNIDLPSYSERARMVARNPVACARFFHVLVQAFIQNVLHKGSAKPGLFGHTAAYYGTVEEQGRLALHLHLLLWIKGSLTPQQIRDRLLSDPNVFRQKLIDWLEGCHQGEFSTGSLATVKDRITRRCSSFSRTQGDPDDDDAMLFTNELVPGDPTASLPTSPPVFASSTESAKWYEELQLISNEVVYRSSRHSENHCHGCRTSPAHECRARFPRELHQFTTVDDLTGALVLKKHEGWINTFSVPLSYLLRCNTDVTCLLSGTMVCAVIAYVTDYVTKSSLKTHTMFDVIRMAVDDKERYVSDDGDTHVSARKLVTRVVNALTAKTEIGGPLVCCHLLGNPEHYTDRTFKPFFWLSYAKIVALAWNEPFYASDVIPSNDSDKVVITSTPTGLTPYEKVYDYTCRPRSMEQMSLVDFLAVTNVVLLPRNKHHRQPSSPSDENEDGGIESGVNVISRFLVDHPKFLTHGVYHMEDKFRSVLTYLGPVLPRKDKGDIEFYCRTMLTLFCPWRDGMNLRTDAQTWKEAFDVYPFSERHLRFMQNMNVLYECRDAAHDFAAQRDARNSALVPNVFDPSVVDDLKQPLGDYDNASMTEVDILNLLELTANKESSPLVKDQLVNLAKENEFLTLLSLPSVRS